MRTNDAPVSGISKEQAPPNQRSARMPVSALIAVLASYTAMYFAGHTLWELPVFAVAALLSYVVSARLPGSFFQRLPLRAVVFAAIIAMNPNDPNSAYEQFGNARSRNLISLVCAAEAAIQFWIPRDGDSGAPPLIALWMAGMTLLAASNTFDERFIRWFAPLYFASAVLAARSYRLRPAVSGSARGRRVTAALRSAALILGIGAGFSAYRTINVYRGELTDWSNRFLFRDQFQYETTGMSEQPELGPMFGLRGSTERILSIVNGPGDPHWRGIAFDTYAHGKWGPAARERPWTSGGSEILASPKDSRAVGTIDLRVTRLVSNNTMIYAPLGTASIDPGDAPGLAWSRDSGGPLRTRAKAPYEYTVSLPENSRLLDTYQGLLTTPQIKDTKTRDRYLTLPSEKEEPEMAGVRALALRITAKAKTPRQKAGAVTEYLLKNYTYSLDFRPSGKNQDAIADFLLASPKKGAHCEFFATAAALLLRYSGVPARYVTGYYAHESGGKSVTVVRQRDAHAWCEAWISGIGWITVDATPGDGRPDADTTPVESWRRIYEWFQDRMQAFADFLANLTPEQTNVAIGVGIAAVVGYGLIWFVLRRRRRKREETAAGSREYPPADAALAELGRRFEGVWTRAGGPPFPESRTYASRLRSLTTEAVQPVEAGQVPPVLPEFAAGALDWAELYDAARYGGRFDAETRQELERMLAGWETPAGR